MLLTPLFTFILPLKRPGNNRSHIERSPSEPASVSSRTVTQVRG